MSIIQVVVEAGVKVAGVEGACPGEVTTGADLPGGGAIHAGSEVAAPTGSSSSSKAVRYRG